MDIAHSVYPLTVGEHLSYCHLSAIEFNAALSICMYRKFDLWFGLDQRSSFLSQRVPSC